jgi:hypothetical protein
MDWQPMETAPTDGSPVAVRLQPGMGATVARFTRYRPKAPRRWLALDAVGGDPADDFFMVREVQPTGWLPIRRRYPAS